MKWFKHYTNANKGGVVEALGEEFGVNRGYGLYFRFVEYCCDKWDGRSEPKFKFNFSKLSTFLGLKHNKLRTFLVSLQNESSFSFKQNGNFLEIYFPKLLEIKHRDGVRAGIAPALRQHHAAQIKSKRKRNTKKEVGEKKKYEKFFLQIWDSWPSNGDRGSKKQTSLNVAKFVEEHGEELASKCVKNYLDFHKASRSEYPYRLSNFFGKMAYWEEFQEPKKAPLKNQTFGEGIEHFDLSRLTHGVEA